MAQRSNPKYLVFDVYETLLDMSEVERRINNLLDSKRGYLAWFNLFMEYCFVDNCIEQFNDFPTIAKATLQMAGKMYSREIDEAAIKNLLELLKQLPVHEGVEKALSGLIDKGFYIAALTNSQGNIVTERMERTGLISYFKKVLSAEQVRKYKPDLRVYEWAAREIGAELHEILLVSAHGWDIAGAANAGMQTAYIRRANSMHYPLAPSPHYTAQNLPELADMIVAPKF